MYGKIILIILIILFLIYLWNNITEMLGEQITFTLYENMFHDKIFFKLASILSEQTLTSNSNIHQIDGNRDTYNMTDIISNAQVNYLEYIRESPSTDIPPTTDSPYFTYSSSDKTITIGGVVYVSGFVDLLPAYCTNNNNNINLQNIYRFKYPTETNLPLFNSRLAVIINVDQNYSFINEDMDSLILHTKIIKLKHNTDNVYKIMYLENDTQTLDQYFDSPDKKIMYIYEGIDITDNDFLNYQSNIYSELINIKCSYLFKLFSNRTGNAQIDSQAENKPEWMLRHLLDHLILNIGVNKKKDNPDQTVKEGFQVDPVVAVPEAGPTAADVSTKPPDTNNLILDILVGPNIYSSKDGDVIDIIDGDKFKQQITHMKYNTLLSHYYIKSTADNNILENLTLDISNMQDTIQTMTVDEYRNSFVTLLTGSTQVNSNEIHNNMDYELNNIQNYINFYTIGKKKYLRLPYLIHMCSDKSDLIGTLNNLIIEKRGDKYYISYTDVCRYNSSFQKVLGRFKGSLSIYAGAVQTDGTDSIMLDRTAE